MKQAKRKRKYLSQEDVPAFSLEEAIRIPQAIFDNYGKAPTAPLKVAAALDLTPSTGHFRMLCGAAIAYGLTEGGCNALLITVQPLAKRILTSIGDGDNLNAKREAFLRPRVIKEFVEKYNNSPAPKQEIAVDVLSDLGVPDDKAASVFLMIMETAEKLGFIQEIRGKKYFSVENAAAFLEDKTVSQTERGEKDSIATNGAAVHADGIKHSSDSMESKIIHADSSRSKRVFITHGKNKSFVDPIKKLLHFGELEAVVAVEKQTVSEPVPDKVMNDMRSCGAAIIHVEGEMKLMDATANEHIVLNPNVLIEIGAAMALYGKRFILLVKDGIKLPSNLQGLYCVRYVGDVLDGDVTIKLLEAINELKKWPLVGGFQHKAQSPAVN